MDKERIKVLSNLFGHMVGTFDVPSKKITIANPSFNEFPTQTKVTGFNDVLDVNKGTWGVFALYNRDTNLLSYLTVHVPVGTITSSETIKKGDVGSGIFGIYDTRSYDKENVFSVRQGSYPIVGNKGVTSNMGLQVDKIKVFRNEDGVINTIIIKYS